MSLSSGDYRGQTVDHCLTTGNVADAVVQLGSLRRESFQSLAVGVAGAPARRLDGILERHVAEVLVDGIRPE